MLVIVWEYEARADRAEEFEAMYRPDGAWSELFREAPGFVSITLMKDLKRPSRYLVADRWTSVELYEEFKRDRRVEYEALSERGARLYASEKEVGRFDFVD